jgi:glycosyltransferase involved in cell wall biosynthesis
VSKAIRVLAMLEARSITGSAKSVLEFAREAARKRPILPDVEMSIMTFNRGDGCENSLTEAIRRLSISFDIVSERRRFDTRVIPRLRALVGNQRPDLIWSNSVKSHFLVRLARLNQSCRWVAFHHGYTATDVKMRIYNQLDRWSLPAADRVLTSSAAFIADLERDVNPDRIRVQHMPIRPFDPPANERIEGLRRQLGLNSQTRVLLSVGRLSQEKGHADLIRALPKIRNLVGASPLRLVIVGEGPERCRIEELCRRLGLTDSVTLAGFQDDINPYYSIADVFVLHSHSEGSPNVLLEAMAAGVPVVAASVGGVPETVVSGRDALLVKPRDPSALASAVTQLLGDQALCERLVSSARETVARKTPEAYFASIASVFHEVVGR